MLPRVMLVEDDDVIREIYALKLELEGFPLATAANGRLALEAVGAFKPEFILLDMVMPEMGGAEFLREMQAAGHDLPFVIVFTNLSHSHPIVEVMELGAREHWLKSNYTPERVAEALKERWGQPGRV